jgi:DHA2 family multidrug resistance protein
MAKKTRGPSAADQGWTPARSVAGKHNPWTIIGVISIATFMVVLDSAIANVALAHIAGSLSASYDEAAWVVTSFLVANAVIIPVSGWLADVFGRKRFYMFSVALFTISSLLCGLAPNLTILIMARVLQGIGGGGLAPVEQSMMADTFPPSKRGAAFAVYGIVVIVAPILGPSLGGWITDNYSWHWVFLINGPIGILSLVLVSIYVDEPPALVQRAKELRAGGLKVDFVGFFLSALFLGALEITMDRGQREDWFSSPMIVTSTVLGVLALVIFIPWELTRKDPIVRIDLFKRANFAISNIFMLLVGLILLGTTQFIPQLLQQVLGYTATQAGEALTMGGIATIVVMPIAGMLTGKVDARYLLAIAMTLQAVALWHMSGLNTEITFQDAALARMIQSVGMPLMFVPISAVAYVGLKPTENNQASALMNVSRNLGGTIGISFAQTMLARQSQVHQSQYVEGLNPLNPNYNNAIAGIAHGLQGQGLSAGAAHQAAGAVLYETLQQQVAMLSYIDIFHVMMWMVIVCLPLIFFLRAPKAGAAPAEMAH